MSEQQPEEHPQGPDSWENWRAANRREPMFHAGEFPLYTDAWLTGEITSGVGPYQVFNTVAISPVPGEVMPRAVLRVQWHVRWRHTSMDRTDSGSYHGGNMADEIAALASLLLGIRLQAGGQTRSFDSDGDPLGKPVAYDYRPQPKLPTPLMGPALRLCTGEHSLMPLERLCDYPLLTREEAIAFVRAARLYQQALWVGDSDPSLAWLMFVSAVETAANQWDSSKGDPLERLREAKPQLVSLLDAEGKPRLSERVARMIADSIGSTRKFGDFLTSFLPAAPEARPADWAQVEWTQDNLRRCF